MKRLIFLSYVLLAAVVLMAEDSIFVISPKTPLESMEGVEIVQDSAIFRLLRVAIDGNDELIEIDGYRVQVFSSNQQQAAKAQALNLETKLKDQVTQSIHVLYMPPFWKVRIGDFRTYDEAKEYKKALVQVFPELMSETYIVRDKVQVLP